MGTNPIYGDTSDSSSQKPGGDLPDKGAMTRRRFLSSALAGAGVLLLAACAPSTPPAPTAAPAPAAPAPKPAATTAPAAPQPTTAAAAPKPAATAAPAAAPKPLNWVGGVNSRTLDPAIVTSSSEIPFTLLIHRGLAIFDDKMVPQPDLATKWEVAADKLTWTFTLRTDAKFSDGSPLTSQDVKATFDRLKDPATKSSRRGEYTRMKEIQVPNPQTVVYKLEEPFPDLPALLADGVSLIISKANVEKAGKDFGIKPMGAGPFMIREWSVGEKIVLAPNPNYYGPKPSLSTITYRGLPEAGARQASFLSGEADLVTNLPPQAKELVKNNPELLFNSTESMQLIQFEINVVKPPLNDPRVRRALNHLVDKQAIINQVLAGLGDVALSPMTRGLPEYQAQTPYDYNVQKAKQLLAEAGYPNGFPLSLWAPEGRYVNDRQVAEAVQGYLRAGGINASLKIWEFSQFLTAMAEDPTKSEKQLMMAGRLSPYADHLLARMYNSAVNVGTTGTRAGSANGYSNPEVDKLLDKARLSFDPAERKATYNLVQKTLWEDAPAVFLHQERFPYGVKKGVEGVRVLPNNYVLVDRVSKA